MTEATTTTTTEPESDTPSELDLAFIIDATGSMGSYIKSAQEVTFYLRKNGHTSTINYSFLEHAKYNSRYNYK